MMNLILNGIGATEATSRSGSTNTYSISTPSGNQTNLTLDQYNQITDLLAYYNDAYGIAYSYDLPAPNWADFTPENAQTIVDDYVLRAANSGKTSKSAAWANTVMTRYVQITATQQEPTQQETTQKNATSPPVVDIPDNVVPKSDDNKPNWKLIGIIGACLVGVGALVFGAKKKRR